MHSCQFVASRVQHVLCRRQISTTQQPPLIALRGIYRIGLYPGLRPLLKPLAPLKKIAITGNPVLQG